MILFGEKNCPLGRFLTPALCTASHRVFGPWGLICPGFRLPGEAFLRINAQNLFGRNRGFSPNGGLRARNSMRSGAKGGGWRWTLLCAPTIAVNGWAGTKIVSSLAPPPTLNNPSSDGLLGVGGASKKLSLLGVWSCPPVGPLVTGPLSRQDRPLGPPWVPLGIGSFPSKRGRIPPPSPRGPGG